MPGGGVPIPIRVARISAIGVLAAASVSALAMAGRSGEPTTEEARAYADSLGLVEILQGRWESLDFRWATGIALLEESSKPRAAELRSRLHQLHLEHTDALRDGKMMLAHDRLRQFDTCRQELDALLSAPRKAPQASTDGGGGGGGGADDDLYAPLP